MKKVLISLVALLAVFALVSCATTSDDAPFAVGDDVAVKVDPNATAWAGTETVNVYIHAGDDVLFNGKVTLTSDGLYASEFLLAACEEVGLYPEGVAYGFVTSIGDYVGAGNDWWLFNVEGQSSLWACNEIHMFDGQYLEFYYGSF